jgi:hypothetical protein
MITSNSGQRIRYGLPPLGLRKRNGGNPYLILQKIVREIMVFLHSHGVGTARAVRDGIAAYCKPENKVSLGFVEGLNNKIRVFQRRAYGLRDNAA